LPWMRSLLFGIPGRPGPMNGARTLPTEIKERSMTNRTGARAPLAFIRVR